MSAKYLGESFYAALHELNPFLWAVHSCFQVALFSMVVMIVHNI